jgi:hypothetical protein
MESTLAPFLKNTATKQPTPYLQFDFELSLSA